MSFGSVLSPARVAALGVAAVFVFPGRFRLDRRFPGAGIGALRPHATVALAAAAGVLAVPRRTRPTALGLGAVAALSGSAVAGRAIRRAPATDRTGEPARRLTLLVANVFQGRADIAALAGLIGRERPDFVILPEAGGRFRDRLMPLLTGYRAWCSAPDTIPDVAGVLLLAAGRTGELTVHAGGRLRFVHATGGVLGARNLYAVHPFAPSRRRWVHRWQRDLGRVGRWSREPLAPIIAGDFNATADHAPFRAALGGCRDAADGTGRGLVGTWPARLPRWAGIQIDHVLVPAGAATSRFEVVDIAGSDHRGLVVGLTLPADGCTG